MCHGIRPVMVTKNVFYMKNAIKLASALSESSKIHSMPMNSRGCGMANAAMQEVD